MMRKGYIYYILDLTNADMYIGSCWKDRWNKRKLEHRNLEKNNCSSKQIIENNNYIFEIFEENEFIEKKDRLKREQLYIENNKCINKYRAYNSDEYNRGYHKQYLEKNRDILTQYKKEYYENNKDKFLEIFKEYRIKNKDIIKEKLKEYRKENKEKIDEKAKIKIKCDNCNLMIRKSNILRHKKSKKCININNG
jgi:hypothetical protein